MKGKSLPPCVLFCLIECSSPAALSCDSAGEPWHSGMWDGFWENGAMAGQAPSARWQATLWEVGTMQGLGAGAQIQVPVPSRCCQPLAPGTPAVSWGCQDSRAAGAAAAASSQAGGWAGVLGVPCPRHGSTDLQLSTCLMTL